MLLLKKIKKALPFYVVDQHVTVNNIKLFSVAMEKQECVAFELLSSYKIFNAEVNNAKVRRSLYKVPIFLSDFKEILSFSTRFNRSPQ
jgi:hypothetical protein